MNGEIELTDLYGLPLRKGIKVAFNLSGAVAIGWIEEIKPAKRYGKTEDYSGEPYFNFHIRQSVTGCISIVRNRPSVVNIE